jgi:hypothetical protein
MPPNIARHLNKMVFVSIPALFEDGVLRPYTLVGAELNGLWLQSEELARRLLPRELADHAALAPAIFVPLAQIAGVMIAAPPPAQGAPVSTAPASGTEPEREKSDQRRPRRKPK